MNLSPLVLFILSAALFVALLMLVQTEIKKGNRVLLANVRQSLDAHLVTFNLWRKRQWQHFVRYILQLGWYYSLHSLLQGIMRVLVAIYEYIETHFERNRLRTKDLRAQKRKEVNGHLSAVAEHKAETSLTPKQQEALKEKILEEKH